MHVACSHFPFPFLQTPVILYFVFKRYLPFTLSVSSWFFRFMRSTHLCKTHAHTKLMSWSWQYKERVISAYTLPGTQSTTVWGRRSDSISTFLWPVGSADLQPRDCALIGRHNVWEFWGWTELTANYRSLPVQSERALEPSRELLDFEKCLLSLASPVTVTLL